jgi:alkylhydroperoxidase family enzyme
MAFIETPAESELYEPELQAKGYVFNYTRVLAHRPDVIEAWKALMASVKANMDPRRYELATLAAARALRSSYCCLAHGKLMTENWFTPQEIVDVMGDRAQLDAVDAAVMRYAAKVATDAPGITQADVDELLAVGLTHAEVLDVAMAAALRCFFSTTLDAVGARPDAQFRLTLQDELREALTVGRPLADQD